MTHIASSLLLHAGLIAREHLVHAEALRQREGGTIGECLVRLAIVSEEQLVDFYHRRLLVPRIAPEAFAHVSPRAVAALEGDMAAEFRVFPVEIDADGTITLAMADPANTHVIDELTFFTDRFLQRAVAAESVIKRAIERYYGMGCFDGPFGDPRPPLSRAITQVPPAPKPVVDLTPASIVPPPLVAEPVVLLTPDAIVPQPIVAEPVVLLTPDAIVLQLAAPRGDRPGPIQLPAAAPIVDAPQESEAVVLLTRVKRSDETPLPQPLPMERDCVPEPANPSIPPPQIAAPQVDPDRSISSGSDAPLPTGPSLPGVAVRDRAGRTPTPASPTSQTLDESQAEPILLTQSKRRSITLSGFKLSASLDAPLAELRNARSRDEIADLLLDYVQRMAPRVALFVIRKGHLVGHDTRGVDLDPAAVGRLFLDIAGTSLFSDVIRSRLPYRGPMPESSANRGFLRIIGERPGEVLLLPIALRERVIAVLYADGINAPLPDAALHAVSREAGRGYERLILSSKR